MGIMTMIRPSPGDERRRILCQDANIDGGIDHPGRQRRSADHPVTILLHGAFVGPIVGVLHIIENQEKRREKKKMTRYCVSKSQTAAISRR